MADLAPRLLDTAAAASYLGVSPGYVRGLMTRGELVPVRLPSCRWAGEVGRRLLFDARDLDALVERWKSQLTIEPHAGLSAAALEGWRQSPVRRRGAA